MRRKVVHLVLALAMTGAVLATTSGAATADAPAAPYTTVAAGLNNPRQLTFDSDGNLFVAEAGSGKVGATDQSGVCAVGPEGESCPGNTGSIIRIHHPRKDPEISRVASGLLSLASPDGSSAVGVDAVSVRDHRVFGIMTYAPPAVFTLPTTVANQNGKLLRFDRDGDIKIVADIGTFSVNHPLPGHEVDSDPYGVLVKGDDKYVVDAANNTLYKVDDDHIKTIATFETVGADGFDGVPTSIAFHDDHLYVGQLSSFAPGQAKVTVFSKKGKRLQTYGDLTAVTAVAVARNGDIYATEIFTGEPFNSPGALVKIPADGGPRVTTPLPAPGGVAVDRHGNVYVSINSVAAGTGSVVRFPH